MVAVFLALMALPFRNGLIGRPTVYPPFTLSLPAISVLTLNLLGKMSFGAMSGFDSVAILAGECRDAARSISRSVIIAAPIIAAMFVFGTSSVVALVPKDKIDLISPISQALTLGTRPGDPGASLLPFTILALLVSFVAQMALTFAFTTRLPLVAGWDNLLPEWFGRLHPAAQNTDQFDSVRRGGGLDVSHRRCGRRGAAGSIPIAPELRWNLLRARIPGHVRAAAGRTSTGHRQTPALAKGSVGIRFRHDRHVPGFVAVPDY